MEAIQWAIGLLVLIETAVIGFIGSRLWTHVAECRTVGEGVAARLASIYADVDRMKEDIGTTDKGMRHKIHELSNRYTEHEMRITLFEIQKAGDHR